MNKKMADDWFKRKGLIVKNECLAWQFRNDYMAYAYLAALFIFVIIVLLGSIMYDEFEGARDVDILENRWDYYLTEDPPTFCVSERLFGSDVYAVPLECLRGVNGGS